MSKKRDAVLVYIFSSKGAMAQIAEACGITIQAVADWSRVPAPHVLTVERVTGIPRERLRPDVFASPIRGPSQRRSAAHVAA